MVKGAAAMGHAVDFTFNHTLCRLYLQIRCITFAIDVYRNVADADNRIRVGCRIPGIVFVAA
jgi:hypothetical protein